MCPISHEVLIDPVMADDGQIYERKFIEQWLMMKARSPLTNKPMAKKALLTAYRFREAVLEKVDQLAQAGQVTLIYEK
jgi:hypothetical protein